MRRLLPDPADDVDILAAYALPDGADRHLRANMVSSLDGAATVDGRSGGLSGPADRDIFLSLRDLADVILVGASTVRVEDYGPARPRRSGPRRGTVAPIAVISRSLDLDPGGRFFAAATVQPIVYTVQSAPTSNRTALEPVSELVTCGGTSVDVAAVIDDLAGRGLRKVLCEGGLSLLAQLLSASLVDELCLTFAPLLAGGERRRSIVEGQIGRVRPARLTQLLEDDGFLFARYAVSG